jgi:20S proteasome subunit alpha 1
MSSSSHTNQQIDLCTTCSSGYDRHITVFSPEGRLYQIEYAFEAVKAPGLTAIGVRGKDSVVVVTQKKVPDKLLDPTSVSRMFKVSQTIGCCSVGLIADAKVQVQRAQYEAAEFNFSNGFDIPVSYAAEKVANVAQYYTQHAFMRPYGVTAIMCGIDSRGPQLFLVDPSGHFSGMSACSAGFKDQEAIGLLEKKVKANPSMSFEETVQCAVLTLQQTVGADLKPSDLEIGVVTTDAPRFRTYSEKEIDDLLTSLSDRD